MEGLFANPLFWVLLLLGGGGKGGGTVPDNGNGNGNGVGGLKGLSVGKVDLPPPEPTGVPRPPGHAFNRNCLAGEYNVGYWPTKASVKASFKQLGYPVPPNRDTMNAPGPDGVLGGGDDVPNPWVSQFQDDYNAMSGKGLLGSQAGGLKLDGFVGPCVLNGIEMVFNFFDGVDWQDAVAAVVTKPGG